MSFLSRVFRPIKRLIVGRPSKRRWLYWLAVGTLLVVALDGLYLAAIWPDWKQYAKGSVPKSKFIADYEEQRADDSTLPALRWQPLPLKQIPSSMIRAVLAAEDSRFYQHGGIDVEALKDAMEYNWEHKRFVFGASTISQQTAKNMFLSPSRNPLRKLHELLLTYAMENQLSKRRILELYLNVAEFGRGVYGVDAAARKYWGISAAQLSYAQCIELAATLPAPSNHNPATRTKFFLKHRNKIQHHLTGVGDEEALLEKSNSEGGST